MSDLDYSPQEIYDFVTNWTRSELSGQLEELHRSAEHHLDEFAKHYRCNEEKGKRELNFGGYCMDSFQYRLEE